MDEETQELVKENIRLTRENNRLLKKLWSAEVMSFWSRLFFIAIMIGLPVLIYKYYLADTVGSIKELYKDVQAIPDDFSLSAVLESVKARGNELVE